MDLRDSRRLTGPNLLTDRPGAILDLALEAGEAAERAAAAVEVWRRQARRILDAVGWAGEGLAHRVFPGGASLVLTAPIDALYAATEVGEWAWGAAAAILAGGREPDGAELAAAAESLRARIREESNPPLSALRAAAGHRGLAFLSDDEWVSVGLGSGSRTWPVAELPEPGAVDWERLHDVPVALVTGTNGKTTTVRMLAAAAEAAGEVAGCCSTDWIRVGSEVVERGDWSGPGGARAVLRDRRVEMAILETARGGLLRRGLAVERAEVAVITNVGEDHLGEFGVADLEQLAATKLVVARVARQLVLNADDPVLRRHGEALEQPVAWFSLEPGQPFLCRHLAAGGDAWVLEGEALVARRGGGREVLLTVSDVPSALGGAALHNVANALAAAATAHGLGLPAEAVRAGLAAFGAAPEDNPGRLNRFELGGVTVLVDFAHNPHGLAALAATAAALPARRRLVVVGQAGDRDDAAIRGLARAAWAAAPDRVIVKEMEHYRRGRAQGEVPRLLEEELRAAGAPAGSVVRAPSELEAVRQAFAWALPGDLLMLLTHESRDEVLALVGTLKNSGWRPGIEVA